MQIEIRPTESVAVFDGVPCRMWHGRMVDTGQECLVLVHRIAVPLSPETPLEQFERELLAQAAPLTIDVMPAT